MNWGDDKGGSHKNSMPSLRAMKVAKLFILTDKPQSLNSLRVHEKDLIPQDRVYKQTVIGVI